MALFDLQLRFAYDFALQNMDKIEALPGLAEEPEEAVIPTLKRAVYYLKIMQLADQGGSLNGARIYYSIIL